MPAAVSQIVARCTRGDNRSQPKIHSPMNVASRANAARPSIASGAPNTPPTNSEYTDQFIPNWNSCTSPVATPMAKLMSSSVPKNFVRRSQASTPVRYHAVCMIATSGARPERERHEEEVVDRRHRELHAREVDRRDGERGHRAAVRGSGAASSSQSIRAASERSRTCGPRDLLK